MADRVSAMRARIQQLRATGKTDEEIRAMKDQIVAEADSAEGGARQQLGPSPAGSPDPTAYRQPTNPLEAVQQGHGMLSRLAAVPGQVADAFTTGKGPIEDPRGAARSAMMGARSALDISGQYPSPADEASDSASKVADLKREIARMEAGQFQSFGHLPPPSPEEQARMIASAKADLAKQTGYAGTDAADAQAVDEHKVANFAGGAAAVGLTPGGQIGEAATGMIPAATGLGRIARGFAVGGLASGGDAAIRTGLQGGDAGDVSDAALNAGPLGAILGGMGATVGEGLGAVRNAVKNSKGGQARQLIESQGGNVGPFDSGSQGPFAEGGELAGKKPTSRDIGTASRDSAGTVLRGMEGDLKESLKGPLAEKAQLDAANKGHVVVNDLVGEMQKLQGGELLSPGEQSTVDGWLKRLDKHAVMVDGQPSGVYAMTPKALNEFRTMLDGATGAGEAPGTVAKAKMQGVAGVARGLVDQTDYGPVNEKIHGARSKYEGDRRLLGLGDRQATGAMAPESVPNSEINRVTNMMARQGQNTVTAGGQNTAATAGEEGAPAGMARERLDQLAERSPQYRRAINMPRTLEAKGDLTARIFPDSDRGGLLDRVKSAATSPAGAGLLAGGASGVAGHPGIAAALATLGLLGQNAAPIQGRLMYTPAMLGGALGDAASPYAGALAPMLQNPLDALNERKKRKKAKR